MKSIYIIILILFTQFTYAQTREGSITYTMNMSGADKNAGMMNGSTLSLFFKNGSTRSEANMGGMMTMATISNSESKKVLMLMDLPAASMKFATLTNIEEAEKSTMNQKPEYTIRYENETKDILGYTCKKAVFVTSEGHESVFWYTPEIGAFTGGHSYMNYGLGGIPLEYTVVQQGMLIQFTATAIETSIDPAKAKSLFSMDVPAGYTLKSLNELMPGGYSR